jgi:PAT family beta-lactamase induction signal transducer AmpG
MSGARRLTTWQSLRAVATSWRLASVTLLSFSSGLPLGLVWIAVPTWMAQVGIDIKVVGLFTLAQAPWSFKFLWSPLMDRYPLPFLGRKRGWILASQAVLFGLGLALAAVSRSPEPVALIGALCVAIAFASATQDIAYDAYTVEVLRREEQGAAVGARVALYRAAMFCGRLAIAGAGVASWAVVNLAQALPYLPAALVTWRAAEPEALPQPPRTLREAVWEPFVGFLAQHRALEILAFVVLYKLADNLTQALTGPFLIQMGYSNVDVGIAAGTIGLVGILVGTFAGGILTEVRGLGPALWISGFLQVFANLGYAVVAEVGVNRPVMYTAQAFEYLTTGMGNGAFGVLLLRLTQKRFSATQYALLSSLFTLPRILAGPPVGLLADALGWRDFFLLTPLAGIPGLVMLSRFVPWGVRDPEFHVAAPSTRKALPRSSLVVRGALAACAAWGASLVTMACLSAIKAYRAGGGFRLVAHLTRLLTPTLPGEWLTAFGAAAVGLAAGLAAAATLVARRGLAPGPE